MEICLLGTLTGQFGNTSHRLTLTLTLLDLILHHLSHILMDMQIVIHLLLDEVADILIDAHTIGGHRQRAQLDLRLTLKHRLFHIDGNCSHNTSSDVTILIFSKEIADGPGDMLLEGTLMGTALSGMLTIDEGIVFLTILIGMGEGNLDILAFQVDYRIKSVVGHTIVQQIFQSMTRQDTPIVIHNGKACIQVGIVAEHILHDIILELIVLEQGIIGLKEDECAVLILRILRDVAHHLSALEYSLTHFSVAIAPDFEMGTQRIDSLHTDTIQSDRLLKGL